MNTKPLLKGVKLLKNFAFKNSETICAIAGITAFGVCIVETVKAVPKVQKVYEEKKEDYESCAEEDEEAKREVVWEGIKETAPIIAKPAAAGVIVISTMIVSPIISSKKLAAMEVLYAGAESALESYDKHMEEIAGKKKADQVREAVANDRANYFQGGGIVETGHGNQLMLFMSTGVWFRSSPDYVRLVFSRINENLPDYESMSLNDALDDLGLERCGLADLHGWSAMDGERAEVDLRNTGLYVDKTTGHEEPAIFVSTNEQPLRSVYGELWHQYYRQH